MICNACLEEIRGGLKDVMRRPCCLEPLCADCCGDIERYKIECTDCKTYGEKAPKVRGTLKEMQGDRVIGEELMRNVTDWSVVKNLRLHLDWLDILEERAKSRDNVEDDFEWPRPTLINEGFVAHDVERADWLEERRMPFTHVVKRRKLEKIYNYTHTLILDYTALASSKSRINAGRTPGIRRLELHDANGINSSVLLSLCDFTEMHLEELIIIGARGLNYIDDIDTTRLRRLIIENAKFMNIHLAPECPIEEFQISEASLTTLECLTQHTQTLRILRLTNTWIRSPTYLSQFNMLINLTLDGDEIIWPLDVSNSIGMLTNLRRLCISRYYLNENYICSLKNLESLEIRNVISIDGFYSLAVLRQLPKLTELKMMNVSGDIYIGDALSGLTILSINKSHYKVDWLKYMNKLRKLELIQVIMNYSELNLLEIMPMLRELTVSGDYIKNEELEELLATANKLDRLIVI
jgi:hypothetical protein